MKKRKLIKKLCRQYECGMSLMCRTLMGFSLLLTIMLSCSSEEDGKSEEGNDSNVPFLQMSPYDLNIIKTSVDKESYSFPITIKRIGTNKESQLNAQLDTWNESELKRYNLENQTDYSLLPSEYYQIIPNPIIIEAGENEFIVEVKFHPQDVFSLIKERLSDYAIPLRLTSSNAKISSAQQAIILGIALNYPKVKFGANSVISVNINQEIKKAEIPVLFDCKTEDTAEGCPFDLSCTLAVPVNAEELVSEYNVNNHTQYKSLPKGSYVLEENVIFQIGDTQTSGMVSVDRSKLSVDRYLLPLQITGSSNETILCDSKIQYVAFSYTYNNPVFAESHADPTVIRADDGMFYLYATESGGRNDGMGIYRSANLIDWEWDGQVLHNKFPAWSVKSEYDLWAPEIRKIGDRYVIYYSVAKWGETKKCKIGVADAPSPTGPFYDKGEPLITYEESGVDNCIDPFYWEENGKKYLFWGSFKGIYATELTDDGMSVKKDGSGKAVFQQQVAGTAFEATCIYKKNGYYYLLASIGSCCEGANSTYRVVVGRSTNLMGPYVNKNGGKMLDNKYELVLQGNSIWAGPGHNSQIVLDDAGTEWMIYHSYIKSDTDLGRVVMLDRLCWTEDGWPYIVGKEPSEQEMLPIFY